MRPLEEIARSLYDRRHHAVPVSFRQVRIGDGDKPDDWVPAPNICYDNVDIWVRRCPEYKAVRGWAVFDFTDNPFFRPCFHFAGHSVVQTPDGALMDITPLGIERVPPFIPHPGDFEEFEALRLAHIPLTANHFL